MPSMASGRFEASLPVRPTRAPVITRTRPKEMPMLASNILESMRRRDDLPTLIFSPIGADLGHSGGPIAR